MPFLSVIQLHKIDIQNNKTYVKPLNITHLNLDTKTNLKTKCNFSGRPKLFRSYIVRSNNSNTLY